MALIHPNGVPAEGRIVKAHCSECLGSKNQRILFEESDSWSELIDEHDGIPIEIGGSDSYELLKCCGCDRVSLRHTKYFSEWGGPQISYYPPAQFRKLPQWLKPKSADEIALWHDHFVPRLLEQIYTSVFNSCFELAAMGIRALLEQVMIGEIGDQGRFVDNLATFEREGFVSSKQRETLETVLELGHAAIHRNYSPSLKEIVAALDITEAILESVYRHGKLADVIKKRVPPRKKAQRPLKKGTNSPQ